MKELSVGLAEIECQPTNETNALEVNKISSPVLARLIEEVRNEEIYSINAYNRMHKRPKRSR